MKAGQNGLNLFRGKEIEVKNDISRDNQVLIQRPVYTQHEFDINYSSILTKVPLKTKLELRWKNYKLKHCSCEGIKQIVIRKLPFISVIGKYKWREWILSDIIAGLIIGVMHIPQGMAYAMLAGLEPMYGLYVSFFPALVYFLFGTSRHNSIGTDAIVSLLSGNFLEKTLVDFPLNMTMMNGTSVDDISEGQLKASRSAGLSFCVGMVQVLMSVFQLGFLTRYLSDPLISGFTVGAAIHVFSSQLTSCFGIKLQKPHGNFGVPRMFYLIFKNLAQTNVPTIVMTLISIGFLVFTKEFINPRVIDKIKVPFPVELVLIICGILCSHYLDLNGKHGVNIVGNITQGLNSPVVPDLTLMSSYISDIFITVFISLSICVALANMFRDIHGYSIEPNQEYLAFGLMNIFSSFFLCFTASASLSRSAVQESIGGKTQMTSIIASSLLLFVLLFIGPLFFALPQCILASFIIVALKGMFMKLIELKELFIFSYWDFGTWITTFLITTILDIDYGLIIGVTLAILTIMLRTQSPRSHILGQIAGTDIYKSIGSYEKCEEIEGIKIFRYEGSLYYASSHHFQRSLFKKVSCEPKKIIAKISKIEYKLKNLEMKIVKGSAKTVEEANQIVERKRFLEMQLEIQKSPAIHHVIIDCSTWGFVDFVGVKTLFQLINDFKGVNISVFLANPKGDIRKILSRSSHIIEDQIIFVTVHDAVISALFDQKIETEEQMKIRRKMKHQKMVKKWFMQHDSQSVPSQLNTSHHSLPSYGHDYNKRGH